MGFTSPIGSIPVPFGFEGNNTPADILAFAQRLDDILSPHTYAEIAALTGLWDGRTLYQSDSGALRPAPGFYAYKAATASWQVVIPTGSIAYTPTWRYGATAITVGNGYLLGRYNRIGTFVLDQFAAKFGNTGSSTNAGSGVQTFDLPVPTIAPTDGFNGVAVGQVQFNDSSAGGLSFLAICAETNTNDRTTCYRVGESLIWSESVPVTVGPNDRLFGMRYYEVAEQ